MSDRTQKRKFDPQTLQKYHCFQIWDQGVGKTDRRKNAPDREECRNFRGIFEISHNFLNFLGFFSNC